MTEMNSAQVYNAIEEIAATSSKNQKTALVGRYLEDPLFKRVIVAALDPTVTYGIAKCPEYLVASPEQGRPFDERTWTLIDGLKTRKLTGNLARDALLIELESLDFRSAYLLWRIVSKDLRAGFSESTVNKCAKGTIPEFPYMRCSLPKDVKLDEWDWAAGVVSQEKADGMFTNVNHEESGLVALSSRQGSPLPLEHFGDIVDEIRARLKPATQTHGELLVVQGGAVLPREIGNGVLNSVLNGGNFASNQYPILKVWDQIPLAAVTPKGKCEAPYRQRLAGIVSQLKAAPGSVISLIDTRIVHSLKDAYDHYRLYLAQGKEGTVIKRMGGIWRDTGSSGSKDQVKLKLEVDVDLKVVGIVPGREGTKNEGRAGSLTCETSCGQLRVDVTVKNEPLRDRIDANPDDFIDRIWAVRSNSIMQPSESNELHSLFLPRMVEADYRIDKTEADSLERVRAQFESAVQAA